MPAKRAIRCATNLLHVAAQHKRTPTDGRPTYVCPFCGMTFVAARTGCPSCDGNLVVSIDDRTVYETILPLCGGAL